MRMVVISLIILIILIGVWIWFHFTSVEPVTTYYWENLILLSETIGEENWKNAEDTMKYYSEDWKKTRGLWVYFINQNEIDNIEISMERLTS